ncbi:hypothetical protein PSY81_23735, partial [Shigella flexneri]|nr:hypothetical protein [Shigella flexneri]
SFFHQTVQVARNKQITHKLKTDQDEWVDTPDGIANLLVDHFQDLLTMGSTTMEDDLIRDIPKLITSQMNQEMSKWPELAETQ